MRLIRLPCHDSEAAVSPAPPYATLDSANEGARRMSLMEGFLFDLPDLREVDFTTHNAGSKKLWQDFHADRHARIPVRYNTNPRMLLLDPRYNPRGITFEQYMKDPEIMAETILEWQYWMRFLLPDDQEKGLPEEWFMYVDTQNFAEAAWFGATVTYRCDQVPDTEPFLNDDNKRSIFERPPNMFTGEWAERALAFFAYFRDKSKSGWTFLGRPVAPPHAAPFLGTDGVFTLAAGMRGADGICLDLLADPDYAHELLDFLQDTIIARMKAWRERLGFPVTTEEFGSADDTILLLSVEQYREFVLPLHKRFFDAFGGEKRRSMHLCGNAQRHFRVLYDEVGIRAFDTGFPIDFTRLREELGPETLISGGPRVPLFVEDTPDALIAETERILRSGILEGGRFILQEGNNLAPCTPLEHCQVVHELGKRLGLVPGRG
jgi:hypothetical protein